MRVAHMLTPTGIFFFTAIEDEPLEATWKRRVAGAVRPLLLGSLRRHVDARLKEFWVSEDEARALGGAAVSQRGDHTLAVTYYQNRSALRTGEPTDEVRGETAFANRSGVSLGPDMCGFLAAFKGASRFPREQLSRALTSLRHRGPDAAGEWVEDDVFLGHRRLSIIDLQTGPQPMHTADDRYVHRLQWGNLQLSGAAQRAAVEGFVVSDQIRHGSHPRG